MSDFVHVCVQVVFEPRLDNIDRNLEVLRLATRKIGGEDYGATEYVEIFEPADDNPNNFKRAFEVNLWLDEKQVAALK